MYRVADGELRADPRITHDMVLAIDDYGNPLRTATAGYGRRYPDPELAPEDQAAQARLRLAYTDSGHTNAVELPDAYRTPLPASIRTFEVIGLRPAGRLFGFPELRNGLEAIAAELSFQDWDADPAAPSGPERRLTGHTSVLYQRDDLSGPLPPGVLEPLALPYRSYRQAFTDSLVADLYGGAVDKAMLAAAGYLRHGTGWWLPSGQVFYSPGADDGPAAELDYARRHFFLPHRHADPFGNVGSVEYDRYDLLVRQTRDPLGNLVTAGERDPDDEITTDGNDYRVLAPHLVSDPNRNRSAVAFDLLGRVAGTAAMGKPEEHLGDNLDSFDPDPPLPEITAYFADPFGHGHVLLGKATTRQLYDLDGYRRSGGAQPAGFAVLARETHMSDLEPGQQTKLQRRFSYSDGFGREIQRKGQAAVGPLSEDGPDVEHRWVGSGWTVFNSKGKPVRQYEPFFTATPGFEFARAAGVSSVLFYDPAERVAAALSPDGGYAKTTFDPWCQDVWDAADTVLLDPRDDPDVAGYAGRWLALLSEQPGGWATWYQRRADGGHGRAAQRAAMQSGHYAAGTPTRSWFDSLGRTFLTVERNRIPIQSGDELIDQYSRTHSLLDIQGNEHEARDALGRAVMRYSYAMLGGQVARTGMDSGGGQSLPDVLGRPVYGRSSRGFAVRVEYDELRRPVCGYVSGPGIDGTALVTRTEYGESISDSQARNLRGRVVRLTDGAGVTVNSGYDFKGNLLGSTVRLAVSYAGIALDWSADVPLEPREYAAMTGYDALNRPVTMTTPDASVLLPAYDLAGQLERLDGRLHGAGKVTTFAERIEYNARGQRTLIRYGNGTSSAYSYDQLTFRLTRLVTLRVHQRLQDLRYTYDPVGNPTQISDRAQQDRFFRNQVVSPTSRYVYDALYRLIEATGREHLGQTATPVPPSATDIPPADQPGDGSAMSRYSERYTYDEVGNLLLIRHRTSDRAHGGWTRACIYDDPSLLEPGRPSNRLTGTSPLRSPLPATRLRYDEQGNTTSMPELPFMCWDYADHLHATARQAESVTRDTTYYGYGVTGNRIRKVTDRAPANKKHERLYLGSFEVFREYAPDGTLSLERETLQVFDDKHRLALVETRTVGTDPGPAELTRYQLADHIDSSVLELDEAAQVITYEEYLPYGSTAYQAVRSGVEAPKRYRYTSKEHDKETGLNYCGARYYAPWLGRWTSCDPAGKVDGLNPYQYVRSNPVKLRDPSGMQAEYFLERELEQRAAQEWDQMVTQPLNTGYEYEKGAARAVLDAAVGTFKLVTGLLGASWQEETISETVEGVKNLPAAATQTVQDWDKLSPEEQAYRATTAGIMVYSAGEASAGMARGAVRIGKALTRAGGDLGEIPVPQVKPTETAVKPTPSEPVTVPAETTAATPGETGTPASAQSGPGDKPPATAPLSPAEIITIMEQHVGTANSQIAAAIRAGNRGFFQNLGMSPKAIDVLMNPKAKTFAAQYGNALERAVSRAFQGDPRIGGMLTDARNAPGTIFPTNPNGRSLRPDFGFTSGPLQGHIIDLTTEGGRAVKMTKYHDRVITLEYTRPTF